MEKFGKLVKNMLRIGLVGFGGGNALVPVIEKNAVEESGLIVREDFEKDVVVANITPGALPVELCAGTGRRIAGRRGMVAAAVCVGLPGTVLTCILLAFFSVMKEPMIRNAMFASVGVTAMIIYLVASYSVRAVKEKKKGSRQRKAALLLVLLVFALTGAREIMDLTGFHSPFIPRISTINVLILTFFVIFFTEGNLHGKKLYAACVIGFFFLMTTGVAADRGIALHRVLGVLLVVLSAYGLIHSLRTQFDRIRHFPLWSLLKDLFAWAAFFVALCIPALITCRKALSFLSMGSLSVLMSFGGGDSYIAIAKGIFVGDFLTRDTFYGQLVTASNAMPGSIMCKMLAGAGALVEAEEGNASAVFMAAAGFGVAAGVSGMTFTLVSYIYNEFQSLSIFRALHNYIRPIVGGLLLTVALSMADNNLEIASWYGISVPWILVLTGALCALSIFLQKKCHTGLLPVILANAAIGIGICNVMWIFG